IQISIPPNDITQGPLPLYSIWGCLLSRAQTGSIVHDVSRAARSDNPKHLWPWPITRRLGERPPSFAESRRANQRGPGNGRTGRNRTLSNRPPNTKERILMEPQGILWKAQHDISLVHFAIGQLEHTLCHYKDENALLILNNISINLFSGLRDLRLHLGLTDTQEAKP
ncbi:MAG: hypothetical protein ABIH23_05880, partial [bacterium]